MRIRVATCIAVAGATFALAPAAAAHVTLNPPEWEAGGFAKFDIRVPNERDNAVTTRVSVRFPEQVLSASFQPVEGWRRAVKMARLDEPIEVEGERITEKIASVTWSGGRIEPGEFQEFGVSFRTPEEPGIELAFPAVQAYSGGEVVRWIGPADAEEPAPLVVITEPQPEEGEAAAPATTAERERGSGGGAEAQEGGSDTLSIVALIVGAVGLATGLVALWRGRRPAATGRGVETAAP